MHLAQKAAHVRYYPYKRMKSVHKERLVDFGRCQKHSVFLTALNYRQAAGRASLIQTNGFCFFTCVLAAYSCLACVKIVCRDDGCEERVYGIWYCM